jgi:hypothetical protein
MVFTRFAKPNPFLRKFPNRAIVRPYGALGTERSGVRRATPSGSYRAWRKAIHASTQMAIEGI